MLLDAQAAVLEPLVAAWSPAFQGAALEPAAAPSAPSCGSTRTGPSGACSWPTSGRGGWQRRPSSIGRAWGSGSCASARLSTMCGLVTADESLSVSASTVGPGRASGMACWTRSCSLGSPTTGCTRPRDLARDLGQVPPRERQPVRHPALPRPQLHQAHVQRAQAAPAQATRYEIPPTPVWPWSTDTFRKPEPPRARSATRGTEPKVS